MITGKALLSIIIPTLNEEETIGNLLNYLQKNSVFKTAEVLLIDGGSTDQTAFIAKQFAVRIFHSEKGRARQMNLGARMAKGKVLYFLHADTYPPENFVTTVMKAIEEGADAGCFRMKFFPSNKFLNFFSWFTRVNLLICRGGDQSLFIRKEVFDELGGYNESYNVYEDGEFISRLYRKKSFKILPESVVTSARKYESRGMWALQFHFAMIHLINFMGAGPEKLHAYYRRNIST